MRTIQLKTDGGEPVTVELQRMTQSDGSMYLARVGHLQREVEVHRRHGEDRLRIGGRIFPFHAVRTRDGIDVWIAGRTHRFTIETRTAERRASAAAAPTDEIEAPMPGTVLKINVGPGDSFAAHDPLVVLESMKMEMSLSAPTDGRVREVACNVGEMVQMGQVLITLEPPEDNGAS